MNPFINFIKITKITTITIITTITTINIKAVITGLTAILKPVFTNLVFIKNSELNQDIFKITFYMIPLHIKIVVKHLYYI
jgi:hypothetical protein